MNILHDFIKIYKNTYDMTFDRNFEGQIKMLCKKLNEPFMYPSHDLVEKLEELSFSLSKNINVAIIGQFSSGKSSLLNLILKKECLPTGVVPVTLKPTFLRYAQGYFLRVEFKDGSDMITNIEELAKYTDQRNALSDTKSLHIFAPIPLLKKITLIDTPGLNANENDTLSTLKELENIHVAIWLSLIDNAGKKSEEDMIKANLELLGENSICVLNQKDKLSTEELENILNYAKIVFSKYFKKIIAISCKQARNEAKYKESNFDLLLDFLYALDEQSLKENFVKRKMLHLCQVLNDENKLFVDIFNKLMDEFQSFKERLNHSFDTLLRDIEIVNHEILDRLKGIAQRISNAIFDSIREKEAHFFKEARGFFKKNLYLRYDYKSPFIASDDAFLAMFYNSDSLNKEFKKIKGEIYKHFEQIKDTLKNYIHDLEKKILSFKAEFSNIQKDNALQSDKNFSELRVFFNASEEYFLKDFKELLFKSLLELDLFFENLNLKAFTNYQSATKLSLAFFSTKIHESRLLYELDNSEFSLFYPKKSEIYERVLHELKVYEFENLLIDKPILCKISKNFLEQSQHIIQEKNKLLILKKTQLNRRKKQILEVEKILREEL